MVTLFLNEAKIGPTCTCIKVQVQTAKYWNNYNYNSEYR